MNRIWKVTSVFQRRSVWDEGSGVCANRCTRSGGWCTHVCFALPYCMLWKYLSDMHEIKIRESQTCGVQHHRNQGKGNDFPLISGPANHSTGDLSCVTVSANPKRRWAHTFVISGSLFAVLNVHTRAHTHKPTHTHTQKQPASTVWRLMTESFLPSWSFWHLAGIRSIINNSPAQQRESVSGWGSAHERRRTSARIAACAVTICSPWIFGEPAFLRPPPPAWRLRFLEEARVCVDFYRTGTWCFSCAPFALKIFSCRKELWAVFLFLGCLVLSPSGAGCKHLPFSFWIYFLDYLSVCLKQIICFLCPGDI